MGKYWAWSLFSVYESIRWLDFNVLSNNFKRRHIEYKLLLKEGSITLSTKPISVYIANVTKLHETNIFIQVYVNSNSLSLKLL